MAGRNEDCSLWLAASDQKLGSAHVIEIDSSPGWKLVLICSGHSHWDTWWDVVFCCTSSSWRIEVKLKSCSVGWVESYAVGSACSGWGSELFALKLLGRSFCSILPDLVSLFLRLSFMDPTSSIGGVFQGLFSCDSDQGCRILHSALHGSHYVYNDVFFA